MLALLAAGHSTPGLLSGGHPDALIGRAPPTVSQSLVLAGRGEVIGGGAGLAVGLVSWGIAVSPHPS